MVFNVKMMKLQLDIDREPFGTDNQVSNQSVMTYFIGEIKGITFSDGRRIRKSPREI